MLIIYRKSDGKTIANSGTNSYLPNGPALEDIIDNAISVAGGVPDDYDEFRIHDDEYPQVVHDIINSGSYELIFEDGVPVDIMIYPKVSIKIEPEVPTVNEDILVTVEIYDKNYTDTITVKVFLDGTEAIIELHSVEIETENGIGQLYLSFNEGGRYGIQVESHSKYGINFKEVIVV